MPPLKHRGTVSDAAGSATNRRIPRPLLRRCAFHPHSLAGVTPVKKFTNRKVASERIWRDIQGLGAPAVPVAEQAPSDSNGTLDPVAVEHQAITHKNIKYPPYPISVKPLISQRLQVGSCAYR
jgi:hypothetical protein